MTAPRSVMHMGYISAATLSPYAREVADACPHGRAADGAAGECGIAVRHGHDAVRAGGGQDVDSHAPVPACTDDDDSHDTSRISMKASASGTPASEPRFRASASMTSGERGCGAGLISLA